MSLHSYKQSLEIGKKDYTFYALIMAAMRKADSYNIDVLQEGFPDTWTEYINRYNAPGGVINDEQPT